MTKNQKTTMTIGIFMLMSLVAVAIAWPPKYAGQATDRQDRVAAVAKAPASEIQDGEYYAHVAEIDVTPEDTLVRFAHVTLFLGDEARLTAKNDVRCGDAKLDDCVPTLARGYYVRPSGAPDEMAPVPKGAKIRLVGKATSTVEDLRTLMKVTSSIPVFTITISGGQAVEIRQLEL